MSYRSGLIADRVFLALLDGAMPSRRCEHLAADSSGQPRLLCSWDRERVCCPACAGRSREHALAEGATCPGCHEDSTRLMTHQQREHAVLLVIGLCHRCISSDERRCAELDRQSASRQDGHDVRPMLAAFSGAAARSSVSAETLTRKVDSS